MPRGRDGRLMPINDVARAPPAGPRRKAIRVGGRWEDWVLYLGTKKRNEIIRTYGLSPEEGCELKKAARRKKQTEAQHRYLARQREKKTDVKVDGVAADSN